MNNYSKALKHIDIKDVKKKHQRKIIEQKLQEEKEEKENEHIQSILEVEKYDWRKNFDDQILHIQPSPTKSKVLKSETNEKIIEKENCQLEENNYIDPLISLRKDISNVKVDTVVNEQNLKNLEKSLQKNCNDLNDFKNTFFETSSKVLKDVQEIEESVEELHSHYEVQYEVISNSSIETKKGLEVVERYVHSVKEQVFDEIQKLPINDIQKDFKIIAKEFKNSKNHLQVVDQYIKNHHQDIEVLKEEVFTEIKNLPLGNLQENIERLEKKIDYIKETYSKIEPTIVVKEVIKEGLLNEPPETNNSDSLTPLNQNFVTLDQLQEHYRLFINRIQQQLSTIGGGGETRLQYLDDIVGIATNPSAYDGKYLKYNHSIGQFEFATVSGGGGGGSQTLDDTLLLGNTSSLGMSVGVSTFNNVVVGGVTTALVVNGDARITGILTIGTSTLTLDGTNNTIKVGTGVTITESGNANYSGIITASSFSGNATSATYASSSGIATYATIAGYATSAGIATVSRGLTGVPNIIVNNITASGAYFGGNVSIAGTLSYESLTYIDSVGVITARNGILLGPPTSIGATITSFGDAAFAGIITAASFSGNATSATTAATANVANYATSSGIATYATTAGISTVSQGLTGTPNLNVGVVTATSFRGSGTSLTGIVTSIVAGTNITISSSAGQVTINATGGGGVTSIIAGSGISIDQSTGNVTITATGGGAGGTNLGLVLASTYNMLMP